MCLSLPKLLAQVSNINKTKNMYYIIQLKEIHGLHITAKYYKLVFQNWYRTSYLLLFGKK